MPRNFLRLNPRAQAAILITLLIVGAVVAIVRLRSEQPHPPLANAPTSSTQDSSGSESGDLVLGNPSAATQDPLNGNNYLMVKPYYALSYNNDNGTPNWVSWEVTESDLGDAPRKRTFDSDAELPLGFKVVITRDYTGGGFDRGHMCPHSDRAANQEMSFATFVMTNIIPQAPNVNEKAWAQLEDYGRELVRRQHEHLYIIAGPAGKGGRGKEGFKESLANGKVLVPAACWKIIVVLPGGGSDNDVKNVNNQTRVIAVIMPNDNDSVGEAWAQFRTSPAEIEKQTGFHFFSNVPRAVADALRQQVDGVPIAAVPFSQTQSNQD